MIRPSVKLFFSTGSECTDPVVDGCSVDPYAADDGDAEGDRPPGHLRRDRRSAHRQPGDVGKVDVRVEVGVIEQAEEEEGRASLQRNTVIGHGGKHCCGIPGVDEIEWAFAEERVHH